MEAAGAEPCSSNQFTGMRGRRTPRNILTNWGDLAGALHVGSGRLDAHLAFLLRMRAMEFEDWFKRLRGWEALRFWVRRCWGCVEAVELNDGEGTYFSSQPTTVSTSFGILESQIHCSGVNHECRCWLSCQFSHCFDSLSDLSKFSLNKSAKPVSRTMIQELKVINERPTRP